MGKWNSGKGNFLVADVDERTTITKNRDFRGINMFFGSLQSHMSVGQL
jgi:hypothetical protein